MTEIQGLEIMFMVEVMVFRCICLKTLVDGTTLLGWWCSSAEEGAKGEGGRR